MIGGQLQETAAYSDDGVVVGECLSWVNGSHVRSMDPTLAQPADVWSEITDQVIRSEAIK